MDGHDNDMLNEIFIDLDDDSDLWKKQNAFYELKNSPKEPEPIDFVITGDIEPPKAKKPNDIASEMKTTTDGPIAKTTEGDGLGIKLLEDITKTADKGLDTLKDVSKSVVDTVLNGLSTTTPASTSTSTTTTTQKPKRKTSFWQSLKSIICNDFDLNKSIKENGNPLQPIIDAIDTVEHSETWKNVNKYASKTREALMEGYDELGHRLDSLKVGLKDLGKKFNI